MRKIKAIIEDEEYKQNIADACSKDLEILKIIKAREEDFEFEMQLAEVICGDNSRFPYRTGHELTTFFTELGYPYQHDGSTRKYWVCNILQTSNSYQIHFFLTSGVFKRKHFISSEKDVANAKDELKNIIENSCRANETINISDAFGLNISNELLFNEKTNTEDSNFNELVDTSKKLFQEGNKQLALEKIWDSFERIKTINGIHKTEIVSKIAENGLNLATNYLDDEFRNLTTIGNNYQIRHFETGKPAITNDDEREYLYFRVLSLINLTLKKLNFKQQ